MSETKAWVVSDRLRERSVVVHAESRNAARRAACGEVSEAYVDTHARRAPEWDGGVPSIDALLDAGWWWECGGCYRARTRDDSPIVVGDEVFCGDACRRTAEERRAHIDGVNAGHSFANTERIYDAHDGRSGWHAEAHPSLLPERYRGGDQ